MPTAIDDGPMDALKTMQCMDMVSPFVNGPGQSFPHFFTNRPSPFILVPPKALELIMQNNIGQVKHLLPAQPPKVA